MDDRCLAALLERATDDPAPDRRARGRSAVHLELERPVRARWRWGMGAAGVAAGSAAWVRASCICPTSAEPRATWSPVLSSK